MKKRKKVGIAFIILIAILIILRILLPTIVLKYVNKQLTQLEYYTGNVDDIDIALYRGAYTIKDIVIDKKEANDNQKIDTISFFSSPKIDLSIHWNALWKGKIVGEIVAEQPKLKFVAGAHEDEDIDQDTSDFRELLTDLMPLTINRFDIVGGQIHYLDPTSTPKVDINMKQLNVTAENLSNEANPQDSLPASIIAEGLTYGGTFSLNVRLNALADNPTFDMNSKLDKLDITGLNDFLRAYANVDANKGSFTLAAEFASKNGEFGGYVKPLMEDLDLIEWKDDEGPFFNKLWETILEGGAKLLENRKTDNVGTKINIDGTYENPDIGILSAIGYVLRNAFIRGLAPSIENSINFDQLQEEDKGFFESLFQGDKKED